MTTDTPYLITDDGAMPITPAQARDLLAAAGKVQQRRAMSHRALFHRGIEAAAGLVARAWVEPLAEEEAGSELCDRCGMIRAIEDDMAEKSAELDLEYSPDRQRWLRAELGELDVDLARWEAMPCGCDTAEGEGNP